MFEAYRLLRVMRYLMEKFSLDIKQEAVEEAAKAYVAYQYAQYGMGNVPDTILAESAERVMKDENTSRRIIENVENQKVIEAVKGVVSLRKKTVSVEKFREL